MSLNRDHGVLPHLLLLPSPPSPASQVAVNAAYRPSLQAVISRLKEQPRQNGTILVIAVVAPILGQGSALGAGSLSWSNAQSILAGIYSVVSVICAHLDVAAESCGGPGSVDARVVLVDHDCSKPVPEDHKPAIEGTGFVIPNLSTFVTAYHPWKCIYGVDNEPGHEILFTYLKLYETVQSMAQDSIISVPGGLSMNIQSGVQASPISPSPSYRVVCLGGTFDWLHLGHKLLLAAAALLLKVPEQGSSKKCLFIIGITGDELLKNKQFAAEVQSWDDRATGVIDYLATLLELQREGWNDGLGPQISKADGEINASFREGAIDVQCVRIQDAFGPTITREDMDALVVSRETKSGGEAVNQRRRKLDFRLLDVYEVDVLDAEEITDGDFKAEGFASKISSTEIRKRKAK